MTDRKTSSMAVYENERDLLEDTVYRRLQPVWSEFSDANAVFDEHGPAQLFCAQKICEGSPSRSFPSPAQAHANRESVCCLLVLNLVSSTPSVLSFLPEIGRLMTWDSDSKFAVNKHFQKVGITRKAFSYMGALTIDFVHTYGAFPAS